MSFCNVLYPLAHLHIKDGDLILDGTNTEEMETGNQRGKGLKKQ